MPEEENSSGGNSWSRVCDTCRAAACTMYCKADSAYLCSDCDARVHAANKVASRHERVFVCEACERAPAAFLCKADAASLCTACDADIHSANPLASRHQRVPILPVSGSPCGPQLGPGDASEAEDAFMTQEEDETTGQEDEDEAASWLLLNPVKNMNNNQNNNGYLFGGEADEYLDISDNNSCAENQYSDHQYNQQHYSSTLHQNGSYGGDSVVPVQSGEGKDQQQYHNLQLGFDYEPSKAAYSYNDSQTHSLSLSSIDVGVVPESTTSTISVTHPRPSTGLMELFPSAPIQMPTQLSPMDREARVLRYREKKKTRKFEKTIRYASRKAYAEARPRIKGRFAKRTDRHVEVDQMFPITLMAEHGYGVVLSILDP